MPRRVISGESPCIIPTNSSIVSCLAICAARTAAGRAGSHHALVWWGGRQPWPAAEAMSSAATLAEKERPMVVDDAR